jgi:hypothetical protein
MHWVISSRCDTTPATPLIFKFQVDGGDPDNPQIEYRWGDRATHEFKNSDMLKFVADVYDQKPSVFRDQYQLCIEEEGDVFNEPTLTPTPNEQQQAEVEELPDD